jgi:hypothetical protein
MIHILRIYWLIQGGSYASVAEKHLLEDADYTSIVTERIPVYLVHKE